MKDDELLDSERNIMLMLLLSLKAYALENDELFSVPTDTMNDIIQENILENTTVPVLAVNDENGRLIFSVEMREPTEEVEYKIESGESSE